MERGKAETYCVLTAEPGHLLENVLVDVAFLLEQFLQFAVLVLKVIHFELQTLHLGVVAFPLLLLVVLLYPVTTVSKMLQWAT